MSHIKGVKGSAAFEFIFLALLAALFIWLAEQSFMIFKSSLLSDVAVNYSIDKELKALGWPSCLEDYFEKERETEFKIGGKYLSKKRLAIFSRPVCD